MFCRMGLVIRIGVCVAVLAASSAVSFGQYAVTVLTTPGYDRATVGSIQGSRMTGNAVTYTGSMHAMIWNRDGSVFADVHPGGYLDSGIAGQWNSTQVGGGTDSNDVGHALLWHDTASSVVDLQPADWETTTACAVSDHGQVGYGSGSGHGDGSYHALYWKGTAESAVDLNPARYISSRAVGIGSDFEAGYGVGPGGGSHPLLWHDTAASAIDLSPTGIGGGGEVDAVSSSRQAGYTFVGDARHAGVWSGSADSFVDLHPEGFDESHASGISWSGEYQAGYAEGYGKGIRAMLWKGSSGSAVDLSAYLTSVPYSFIWSTAYAVTDDGVILGEIGDFNGNDYSVMWTPVPEPTSMFALGLGALILMRNCRVHR